MYKIYNPGKYIHAFTYIVSRCLEVNPNRVYEIKIATGPTISP